MILAEHELSEEPPDVFDSHLNLEQINKVTLSGSWPPKQAFVVSESTCGSMACDALNKQVIFTAHEQRQLPVSHTYASQRTYAFAPGCNSTTSVQSLISLNTMYVAARNQGSPAPREAEFRAYHLLSMMGRHGKYSYSPATFLAAVQVSRGPGKCQGLHNGFSCLCVVIPRPRIPL